MDNFYNAEYINVNNNISINETFDEDTGIDPAIYLKVLSVLVIRAGLFIAEVISIPSSNVQVLVLQNMIDLSVTFVGYGLVGYIFAFGEDYQSFIGISGFISDDSNFNNFIQGSAILVIASGLVSAAIGDRISFFAGLVINCLISTITFPLILHWILHPKGWMRSMNFAGVNVSYKDYSHSCILHMAGGYVCYLGMFILDKRMLRFNDLDSSSIPDIGPNLALFGYFLVLLGFIGFSIPSQKYFQTHDLHNFYGIILVNTLFAVFGTVVTTLLLTFLLPCRDRSSKWANLRFAQGGISGVAVIAGGVDVYQPVAALGAGLLNGILFFLETHIMNKTNMEDFCNISAAHFFSGFLGTLLPSVMGTREGFRTEPYNDFVHFAWQLLCDATILTYLTIIFCPILALFDRCGVLRTWDEEVNHKRAISAMKVIPKTTFKKKFLDWGENEFDPSLIGSFSKTRALSGGGLKDQKSGKVSVLFQKNWSEKALQTPKLKTHGAGDESSKDTGADSRKRETKTESIEEEDSVSTKTSGALAKGGAAPTSNSRLLETTKMVEGIRNISDSKLLSKIKDMKKQGKSRKCESRAGLSCSSNLWVPSTSGMQFNVETEV